MSSRGDSPHSPHSNGRTLLLDRTDWLLIVAIVFAALVPRLILSYSLPPLLHVDSDSYFEIAQRLWDGHGLGDLSRRTPLYPMLLAAAGHSRRAGLFPAVLIQHILGIASAVLIYLIARRLFPVRLRAIALASGLMAGLIGYPVLLEQTIVSESLYSFLLLVSLLCLLVWFQENKYSAALGCGALLGLAVLTRPIAALAFPLWAGLLFPLQGARKASRFLLLGGAAFLLLIFPLLIRNYRTTGSLSLVESTGRNLISVTDRFVDYDRGVQLPVKSIYREFLRDKRGPDAVVIYSAMPRLRKATGWNDVQIDRALAEIGWEAIRQHPLQFLGARLNRLPLLFRSPDESQWYALHQETYLPLLDFIGRFDPELVSRSIAFPGLKRIHFTWAHTAYRIFALDLTSGWLLLFVFFGIAGAIRLEKRGSTWLLLALLAYLLLGTVLMQPPNARYRIPTLPLEIMFAIAGFYSALEFLFTMIGRITRRDWSLGVRGKLCGTLRPEACHLIAVGAVIFMIFSVRTVLVVISKPVFNIADWINNGTGGSSPSEIRELPVAGQKLDVIYWNQASEGTSKVISADIPIRGGRTYHLESAYSCQTRECAGARLETILLDARGTVIDPDRTETRALTNERIDNDLYWDQVEWQFNTPSMAHSVRLALYLEVGKGNLVIPYLSIRP